LKKSENAPVEMSIHDRIRRRDPQQFLNDLLMERGYSAKLYRSLTCAYHCEPTELQKASYGVKTVEAVRTENVALLQDLFDAGLSPNACTAFGDSIVHMACRHGGSVKALKFMLEYGSTVQTTDEHGRTPLHAACWNMTPNFPLIRLILEADVNLLRVADGRGMTPLSFVAKKSWSVWVDFLDQIKDDFWPQRDPIEDGIEPPPTLAQMRPGTVPPPEPHVDRTVDVIRKIASGTLDIRDPWITQYFYEDDGTLSSSDNGDDTIFSGCEDSTVMSGSRMGDSDSDDSDDSGSYSDSYDDDDSCSIDDSHALSGESRSKKRKDKRKQTFAMVVDRTPSVRSFAMMVD